jgi:hypothetical protein
MAAPRNAEFRLQLQSWESVKTSGETAREIARLAAEVGEVL